MNRLRSIIMESLVVSDLSYFISVLSQFVTFCCCVMVQSEVSFIRCGPLVIDSSEQIAKQASIVYNVPSLCYPVPAAES